MDRRKPASFPKLFSSDKLRRRRNRGRRENDPGAYVDIYDSRSWYISIAVVCLSLLDAMLTQVHLTKGYAMEWNPLMSKIINDGGFVAFYAAKMGLTIIPMAIILIHKEWTLGKYAARLCLWAYVLLSCWHVFLLLTSL